MTEERRRILNVSGIEVCEWCHRGLAIVAYRPTKKGDDVPEYGPCPWCERGGITEFPTGVKGPHGEPGAKPSWGKEGYWRGRTPAVERPPADERPPFPPQENALRSRLLTLRAGGRDADPLVALDDPDPAARFAALEAEIARVTV